MRPHLGRATSQHAPFLCRPHRHRHRHPRLTPTRTTPTTHSRPQPHHHHDPYSQATRRAQRPSTLPTPTHTPRAAQHHARSHPIHHTKLSEIDGKLRSLSDERTHIANQLDKTKDVELQRESLKQASALNQARAKQPHTARCRQSSNDYYRRCLNHKTRLFIKPHRSFAPLKCSTSPHPTPQTRLIQTLCRTFPWPRRAVPFDQPHHRPPRCDDRPPMPQRAEPRSPSRIATLKPTPPPAATRTPST